MTSALSSLAGVLAGVFLYLVLCAGGLFVWPHYFYHHRKATRRGQALFRIFLIHFLLAITWGVVLRVHAVSGQEWKPGLGLFMILNLIFVITSRIVWAKTDDTEI